MTPSPDADLVWPAVDLGRAARLLRSRQVSASELLEAHLRRVSLLDTTLHACITVMAEAARDTAAALDKCADLDGDGPAMLAGIPIGLKDNFDTAGIRTTGASRSLESRVPARDAAVVSSLRASRALLMAKLNMDELAIGGPFGSEVAGIMVNPWDARSIPGGSSGGSAVAVAAGMCMAATGSDTGGSIRNPAAWCGVAGYKPTQAALPTSGILPVSWSLDTAGWLAHTVEDCARLFAATSVALAENGGSGRQDFVDRVLAGPRRQLRLAVAGEAVRKCEPAVRQVLQQSQISLAAVGSVDEVELPSLDDALLAMQVIAFGEANSAWAGVLRDSWKLIGSEVRATLDVGAKFSAVDYVDAQRLRMKLRRSADALFNNYDVLMMPSLGTDPRPDAFAGSSPGPHHPDAQLGGKMTCLWSLTGNPVISLPCGFTITGRPASMQLVGPRGHDGLLLQAAIACESVWAIPWTRLVPPWSSKTIDAADH